MPKHCKLITANSYSNPAIMSSTYTLTLSAVLLLNSSLGLAVPSKESLPHHNAHDHMADSFAHYDRNEDHNKMYDHQAFLGESEARAFDQLSPEESKKRLSDIVDRIDVDGDQQVNHEELKAWIQKQQKSYIHDDVERQWRNHNPDNKTELKWEDYRRLTYGFMDDDADSSSNRDEDDKTYREMMRRDRRRWLLADRDHDTNLNRGEFTDFLHPEETEHMQAVVVDETIEDIDKDKDGKISLDEYISDLYTSDSTEDNVPDWVIREREQFKSFRDKNGDGFMDREEVREWIVPSDYDHSEAESRHLIHESDKNSDGKLSRQEILDNYDLFVGSQATDFGEALVSHDEF